MIFHKSGCKFTQIFNTYKLFVAILCADFLQRKKTGNNFIFSAFIIRYSKMVKWILIIILCP